MEELILAQRRVLVALLTLIEPMPNPPPSLVQSADAAKLTLDLLESVPA